MEQGGEDGVVGAWLRSVLWIGSEWGREALLDQVGVGCKYA